MVRLLPVLLLLALPAASASAADPMPAPDCHGIQVTDKSGDSVNSLDSSAGSGSPSSDLTAGWFTWDGAKLTANIQVANLTVGEVDAPFDGISWEFQFSAGKPLYLRGFEDISGITKFTWGEPRAVTDDQTTPRAGGTTTGKLFPGPNGVIQIDVPIKDMGIAPGTTLKALALEVRQWATVPAAVPTTPLPLYSPAPIYDTAAGKGGFTLGPCTTPAGPAPAAPAPVDTPSAAAPAKLAVKVKAPKLTARKVNKARKFTVTLTGNATKITAGLASGPKLVGTGKLARLKGKGKLTIKLSKKLKKGRYTLNLAGTNADGTKGGGAIAVKIG